MFEDLPGLATCVRKTTSVGRHERSRDTSLETKEVSRQNVDRFIMSAIAPGEVTIIGAFGRCF